MANHQERPVSPFSVPLRHWCDQNGAEIGNVGYSAGVTADVSLVEERNQEFTAFCESRGMGYRFDS